MGGAWLALALLSLPATAQPPRTVLGLPPPGEVLVSAITQESEGPVLRLRGVARIETGDTLIEAEQVDYDQQNQTAEARGRVHLRNFYSGEELWCERLEYNLKERSGNFYKVSGSAPPGTAVRPGVLRTDNPFRFEGEWAERKEERYILYNGTLTNCYGDRPWWVLTAARFDIIIGKRAVAYQSWFKMKGVPLLYAPAFYKAMEEFPRRSGFLTPNFGTSSRRGYMYGLGYYWAISRSYDMSYRAQYFTQRGLAHTIDVRGKPTQHSEFNAYIYGVNDRGLRLQSGERRKEGGALGSFTGRAELGRGYYLRGHVNHLSSFLFRQSFTESFNEAVFSEVNSTVFLGRDWSGYHLYAIYTAHQNFMSAAPGDQISLRRLPRVQFDSRDRQVSRRLLPLWVSWTASGGLVSRNQPLFQTRRFVERLDAEPRVMTALRWKDIHLVPAFSLRESYYGSSFQDGVVTGQGVNRFSREFTTDLILPTLSRTFNGPAWIGHRVKHTIEPRATFRYVTGAEGFDRLVRFDEMEIVSNTTEVELRVANRLWAKSRAGAVSDVLTWELSHRRFFDPGFGGALQAGRRNVVASSAQMTAYAFLDQPRRYSPVVSLFRLTPRPTVGMEWRTDYDPLRGRLVNSSFTADARFSQYFVSLGHTRVSCVALRPSEEHLVCGEIRPQGSVLSPPANQIVGLAGVGQENRRGWNAGFLTVYDYSRGVMQYANTQVSYNTDCCAFSVQYRRFGFGTRNENQFRVAFVIANIGSFGTLKRQERMF